MAIDPVCNMEVDEKNPAGTSVYKRKSYFFCSAVCKEKFDKDPQKYSGEGKK